MATKKSARKMTKKAAKKKGTDHMMPEHSKKMGKGMPMKRKGMK